VAHRSDAGDGPSVNPYAPPAADTGSASGADGAGEGPLGAASRRRFRIAGGVALIVLGLWCLLGGGCSVLAAQTVGAADVDELRSVMDKVRNEQGKPVFDRARTVDLVARAARLRWVGALDAAAGALSVLAAILLLLDRTRVPLFIAIGVAAVAEGAFAVVLAPNIIGGVKLACYGFAAFCGVRSRRSPIPLGSSKYER